MNLQQSPKFLLLFSQLFIQYVTSSSSCSSDVTITCVANCTSNNGVLNGRLGDEITLRISVDDIQFTALVVFFNDKSNMLVISPTYVPSVLVAKGYKNFAVPTSLVKTSTSLSLDITLRELRLEHDGNIFKYEYTTKNATRFICNDGWKLKVEGVEELVSTPAPNGGSNIVVVWSGLLLCVVLCPTALFVLQ